MMSDDLLFGQQAKGIEGIFIHSRLDDAGLSTEAFRVFSHLARRSSKAGRQAYPGIASIGRVCKISENTVRKAIRELMDRKMIVVQQGGGTATNRYLLTSFDQWTGNFENLESVDAPLHGLNPLTVCTPPPHSLKPPPSQIAEEGTQISSSKKGEVQELALSQAESALILSATSAERAMAEIWHRCVPSLPKITRMSGERLKLSLARWKDCGCDPKKWEEFCQAVEASDFLTGRAKGSDGRNWTANYDWCITPSNFDKVREGRYKNKHPTSENDPNNQNTRRRFWGTSTPEADT